MVNYKFTAPHLVKLDENNKSDFFFPATPDDFSTYNNYVDEIYRTIIRFGMAHQIIEAIEQPIKTNSEKTPYAEFKFCTTNPHFNGVLSLLYDCNIASSVFIGDIDRLLNAIYVTSDNDGGLVNTIFSFHLQKIAIRLGSYIPHNILNTFIDNLYKSLTFMDSDYTDYTNPDTTSYYPTWDQVHVAYPSFWVILALNSITT